MISLTSSSVALTSYNFPWAQEASSEHISSCHSCALPFQESDSVQTEHVQHDEITLEHLMSISTGSIKTFDNWLSEEDHHKVLQYTDHDGQQKTLYGLSFDKYGESEFDENTPNSGLAHIISPNHPIYTTIANKVKKHTDSTIYDMYIRYICTILHNN